MTVPALLLVTVGRKSGEKLIFPLFYGEVGDGFVIIASKGGAPDHPSWYKNLLGQSGGRNPGGHAQAACARAHGGRRGAGAAVAAIAGVYGRLCRLPKKVPEREIPVVVLEPIG